MKTIISNFGSSLLSREQMKGVKGGLRDPNEEGSNFYRCCNDQGLDCNACSSEQTCTAPKSQVRC